MKLKQNSFKTVSKPFCFSFISLRGQFKWVRPCFVGDAKNPRWLIDRLIENDAQKHTKSNCMHMVTFCQPTVDTGKHYWNRYGEIPGRLKLPAVMTGPLVTEKFSGDIRYKLITNMNHLALLACVQHIHLTGSVLEMLKQSHHTNRQIQNKNERKKTKNVLTQSYTQNACLSGYIT